MKIDWNSDESLVLINPRLPKAQSIRIHTCLQSLQKKYPGHVWISTSGSSNTAKWAGLSKQALLISAEAVNQHFLATSTDIWLNPLPLFHVGGLGILARAHQTGAKWFPYEEKWNPHAYTAKLEQCKATLGSLVPTMVHDLVYNQIPAPKSVRALIVGGARLSETLYEKAIELGWPLFPSYGMTECSSQVATVELSRQTNSMKLLPHMEGCITPAGLIALKSLSLLTTYAHISPADFSTLDPKVGGWFVTHDRGRIEGEHIFPFGRKDDVIKIGGENVDLVHLGQILDSLKGSREMVLIAFPDPRLEHSIHLCISAKMEDKSVIDAIVSEFNSRVIPFERIRKVHYFNSLPRNEIGKIKLKELLEMCRT